MKKIRYFLTILISSMLLISCGTNTKENPEYVEKYSFFNATTPLVVRKKFDENGSMSTYTVSVELLGYGYPLSDEIINMKPFESSYGFITHSTVLTDDNGKASFEYNLPENFDTIRGKTFTIQAVYLDNSVASNTDEPTKKSVRLTQDFILEFR